MQSKNGDDNTIYEVVMNHEEQYSIWPQTKELPLGWKKVGKSGVKDECLAHIKEVWTDMRPLSLRKKMEEMAKHPPKETPPPAADPKEKSLVQRLAEGEHEVEAGLRPEKTAKALKESIDRGYVHILFPNTKGGTELGVRLDSEASDVSKADFAQGTGTVHLVGSLTLDYVPVKCIADLELKTLTGKGHLEILEA